MSNSASQFLIVHHTTSFLYHCFNRLNHTRRLLQHILRRKVLLATQTPLLYLPKKYLARAQMIHKIVFADWEFMLRTRSFVKSFQQKRSNSASHNKKQPIRTKGGKPASRFYHLSPYRLFIKLETEYGQLHQVQLDEKRA